MVDSMMSKAVISCAAALTMCLSLVFAGQRQGNSTTESKTVSTFSERMDGQAARVSPREIARELRFHVVAPPQKSDLTYIGYDWWKFPKTNRRPPFGVLEISCRDRKTPEGVIIVLEWKHVPGVSAANAAGIPQTVVLGTVPMKPLIGGKDDTEVACFFEELPLERAKELTKWVPSDTQAQATWGPSDLHEARIGLMRNEADSNARALAASVQTHAIESKKYDSNLMSYIYDLGGSIPVNPCTGTSTGYTIEAHGSQATVHANAGTHCGKWTPYVYRLTLQ